MTSLLELSHESYEQSVEAMQLPCERRNVVAAPEALLTEQFMVRPDPNSDKVGLVCSGVSFQVGTAPDSYGLSCLAGETNIGSMTAPGSGGKITIGDETKPSEEIILYGQNGVSISGSTITMDPLSLDIDQGTTTNIKGPFSHTGSTPADFTSGLTSQATIQAYGVVNCEGPFTHADNLNNNKALFSTGVEASGLTVNGQNARFECQTLTVDQATVTTIEGSFSHFSGSSPALFNSGITADSATVTNGFVHDGTNGVAAEFKKGLTVTNGASADTLVVSGDAKIEGNLTVTGTTTTVNSEQLNVKDSFMLLNANFANTEGGVGTVSVVGAGVAGTADIQYITFLENSSHQEGLYYATGDHSLGTMQIETDLSPLSTTMSKVLLNSEGASYDNSEVSSATPVKIALWLTDSEGVIKYQAAETVAKMADAELNVLGGTDGTNKYPSKFYNFKDAATDFPSDNTTNYWSTATEAGTNTLKEAARACYVLDLHEASSASVLGSIGSTDTVPFYLPKNGEADPGQEICIFIDQTVGGSKEVGGYQLYNSDGSTLGPVFTTKNNGHSIIYDGTKWREM